MMDIALERGRSLTDEVLTLLKEVIRGLQVPPERMTENVNRSGGPISAEAVTPKLGHKIGRQAAHGVIYHAAQEAGSRGRGQDLLEVLSRHP